MNSPETKQRDADATRTALLEAAGRQFAQVGFDGCRNQAIADAAGANKAMINYHFGGKLGLYRAVVDEALDAVAPLLERFEQRVGVADRLGEWIDVVADAFAMRPNLPAILVREHLDGGARLQDEYANRILRFARNTAAVLDGGARDGSLRLEDPHAVHLSLIGALSFFLISQPYRDEAARQGKALPPAPDRAAYVDYLKRLFRSGMAG